jgi:hypothetical protein
MTHPSATNVKLADQKTSNLPLRKNRAERYWVHPGGAMIVH